MELPQSHLQSFCPLIVSLSFVWTAFNWNFECSTWYIRTGIFSTKSPFFSPFRTSLVKMDRRSLLGLWGRGDDWGEISGEDGADLKHNGNNVTMTNL